MKIPPLKGFIRKAVIDRDLWEKIRKRFPDRDDMEILEELFERSGKFDLLSGKNRLLESKKRELDHEISKIRGEMEEVEKDKKRLIRDLNVSMKRADRLKEEVNDLKERIENGAGQTIIKKEVVIRENTEMVDILKRKNEKLKKSDLKHQSRINELEAENNDLRKGLEVLEKKLENIDRANHALIVKVPADPAIGEPEIKVIDSRTYYTYKGDPGEIGRREAYAGRIHLFRLPSFR